MSSDRRSRRTRASDDTRARLAARLAGYSGVAGAVLAGAGQAGAQIKYSGEKHIALPTNSTVSVVLQGSLPDTNVGLATGPLSGGGTYAAGFFAYPGAGNRCAFVPTQTPNQKTSYYSAAIIPEGAWIGAAGLLAMRRGKKA